jgi:putative colanic acid biosynthesis glycosyltransferase
LKKSITFSVITIVYNGHKHIQATVESVISQTHNDFQYIVIDGNSHDGTCKILDHYSEYLDVFISEPDAGIYDAMNKGLRQATGDYVVFMNCGDEFSDTSVLERLNAHIQSCPSSPDFIYGNTLIRQADGQVHLKKARNYRYKWYGMFTIHQSMFYKLSVIRQYDLVFNTNYKIAGDYQFTLEFIGKAREITFLDSTISIFSMTGI